MKHKLNYRKKTGATLVEIMLVFFIGMIILLLPLMAMRDQGRDIAQVKSLISVLREYRSAAIAYKAEHGQWPTSSNGAVLQASLDVYLGTEAIGTVKKAPDLDDNYYKYGSLDLRAISSGYGGASVTILIGVEWDTQSKLASSAARDVFSSIQRGNSGERFYDAAGNILTGPPNGQLYLRVSQKY